MTTFALFYNMQDLTPLTALIAGGSQFTNAERQTAQRLWNGGMNTWDSPINLIGATDPRCNGDTDCRRVIVTGSQVSKQGMIDLCRSVGNRVVGAGFLIAIANDMETSCVEPWPGV